MRIAFVLTVLLSASVAAQTPWDTPEGAAAARVASATADDGVSESLRWSWSPDPRWIEGVGFRLDAFDGGLAFGDRFLGSTVPNREAPPVEIVFDRFTQTTAPVFERQASYVHAGQGVFRGAAYDVSDPTSPRRLNVAITQDANAQTGDLVWNPDDSQLGAREYLIVLASTYTGDVSAYADANAFQLDALYALAAREVAGRALYETTATLAVTPEPIREVRATAVANGTLEVDWTATSEGTSVVVSEAGSASALATAAPEAGGVRIEGLDRSRAYDLTVELRRDDGSVVGSRTASAQPAVSLGVAAVSSLDPGREGTSTYGDTWGYVAPDGTEYGLLAARGGGLSVIDVSGAPAAPPVEVGFVPTASGAQDSKDVKTYGRYAYLVNEVGPVQIIDLADPANPVEVGQLSVQPNASNGGSHNLLVANDHLWVVGGRNNGTAGVRVYALADPTAPAYVGEYQVPDGISYYHDFEVRGTLALGARIYGGEGVDVLDVRDPADIRLVSTFTYPGAGAHNTCMTEDGSHVFVGDEIGSAGNWMRTFDLRDLDNVELVNEIVVAPEAIVHNCYVRGNLLFAAHYTEGLRVFDVSAPAAPVEVAFYDTYQPADVGFSGAWTAYPYLPSGKVLVSDMQSGLWVVELEAQVVADEPAPEAAPALTVAPNPLGASASVQFALPEAADVRLTVLDVRGREVAVLADGPRAAGAHTVGLDGRGLPAGVYLVRLGVNGRTAATARATVVR
ncbi:MAG: choice-of-anchor B family protein [Bacteroidota bacterium]